MRRLAELTATTFRVREDTGPANESRIAERIKVAGSPGEIRHDFLGAQRFCHAMRRPGSVSYLVPAGADAARRNAGTGPDAGASIGGPSRPVAECKPALHPPSDAAEHDNGDQSTSSARHRLGSTVAEAWRNRSALRAWYRAGRLAQRAPAGPQCRRGAGGVSLPRSAENAPSQVQLNRPPRPGMLSC